MNFNPSDVDAFFSGTNALAKAAQNICGAVATCTDQMNNCDSRRNFGFDQTATANQVQVQPQLQYQHQPITYGYGYADDTPFQPTPTPPNMCYGYGYNNMQPPQVPYVYQTPPPQTYPAFPNPNVQQAPNYNMYPGIYNPGYGKGGGMW